MKIDLARMTAAVRSEQYFETGLDRRFQALERRHLRTAARLGMLVIIAVALVGGFALAAAHPGVAALVIFLDCGLGVLAAIGYILLGHRARHYPEPVVFAISIAAIGACAVLGIAAPELAVLACGYLLLIPPILSQVVTWRTWTHTIWLLVFVIVILGFLVLAPISELSASEKLDIAVLGLISVSASFCGHVLGVRSRIRGFNQVRTIQALHRSLERQRSELTRALTELERTSRVDPLTRIANRLRLDEDFEEVRARINRSGGSCGLLEADVDHFKLINDRLGHLAGDGVLRSVAQTLQATLRSGDRVYRYGGEEFVAIIVGADARATEATAERLRTAIAALALPHPDNPPAGVVTISVGWTVIGPTDIDETDDALFDRADQAMYAAKTSGRNRIAKVLPRWFASAAEPGLVALDGTAHTLG